MTDTTGVIQPKATAFDLSIDLPKEKVEFGCNQYWAEIKDRLNPELVKKAQRGGFREVKRDRIEKAAGGKSEFYRPVLVQLVAEYLDTQPRQAIAFNEATLIEGIATDTIRASVYMEPVVTWKKVPGIDEPLTVKLPKLPVDLLDKTIDAELRRAQEENAILVPEPEGTAAALGHVLTLDCNTMVDGKPWEAGTFTNNKWLLDPGVFKIPGMMENLIGLKAGESKTFQVTYPEAFGDLANKTGDVSMRVNQVFKRDIPAIDDDLAITIGKKDLATWKEEITERFDVALKEERDQVIFMNILGMLLNPETVDVEPIPHAWMINKAYHIYESQRKLFRTEEDLLARFASATTVTGKQVEDKQDLMTYFAESAAQNLVTELVVRSWGIKNNVVGDTRLSEMGKYVDAVRDTLLKTATVEEVEVPDAAEAEPVQKIVQED